MDPSGRLRMVLATPLDESLCLRLEALEPRVELVRDHTLLPPMRYPGDHSGDPTFRRTDQERARFEALCGSAEALYGIPDGSSAALARTVAANPRLRWVQTMAAGGASQVVVLGPGESYSVGVTWLGRLSQKGCPADQPIASAGTYKLVGRNGGLSSDPAVFALTAAA